MELRKTEGPRTGWAAVGEGDVRAFMRQASAVPSPAPAFGDGRSEVGLELVERELAGVPRRGKFRFPSQRDDRCGALLGWQGLQVEGQLEHLPEDLGRRAILEARLPPIVEAR